MYKNKQPKLTAITLSLMIFTAVYGFGNVPLAFLQMGYGAIPWYILGALIFFLPFSLMVTEFGSAFKDEKGGIFNWMERPMGTSFALIGTMMWYMSWVLWFVSVGNRILVPISNVFFGTTRLPNTVIMSIIAVFIMGLTTLFSLKGLENVKRIASIGGLAVMTLNFILVFGAIVILYKNSFHLATSFSLKAFFSTPNPTLKPVTFVTFAAFLVYAIFAYSGVESVGGLVDETENPKKNFPKGILISTCIIAVGYSFMILCTGFIINYEKDWQKPIISGALNQGNVTYYMMQQLGEKLAQSFHLSTSTVSLWGNIFARYVGFSMSLSLIGALFTIIYSAPKQLIVGAPKKMWPKKIGIVENEIPKNAIIIQYLIVTLLILLNMIISLVNKGAADKFFLMLTNMGNVSSTIPYVFIVFAYISFRKDNTIKKNFKIIKNDKIAIFYSWVSAIALILANIFTIIEPIIDHIQAPEDNPMHEVYANIISMLSGPILFSILSWWLIKRYKKEKQK